MHERPKLDNFTNLSVRTERKLFQRFKEVCIKQGKPLKALLAQYLQACVDQRIELKEPPWEMVWEAHVLTALLPEDLHLKVRAFCCKNDLTLQELVRRCLYSVLRTEYEESDLRPDVSIASRQRALTTYVTLILRVPKRVKESLKREAIKRGIKAHEYVTQAVVEKMNP